MSNVTEMDVREWLDANTIAYKLWTEADIASCLKEKGFQPSAENIAEVLNAGVKGLSECSDSDWEVIYSAIQYAKRNLKRRVNIGKATAKLINEHYSVKNWVLDAEAVLTGLLEEYNEEEVGGMVMSFVLANPNDGRISRANKVWAANSTYQFEPENDPTRYGAHSGLVDILVTDFRENVEG